VDDSASWKRASGDQRLRWQIEQTELHLRQLDEAIDDLRQRRGVIAEHLMGLKCRAFLGVLCLLVALPAYAQQTQAKVFVWEHPETEVSANIVTLFKLSIDGGAFTAVGMTPSTEQPQVGFKAFQALVPSLTPGKHTVAVQACNAALCSDPTPALEFTLDVKPSTPVRLRFPAGIPQG
jgi:hypothetical protein